MRYTFDGSNTAHMRFSLILVVLILLSCESDDDRVQNPFLVDISFQIELNTNLPQYSSLNFANNAVIENSIGLKGVVIYRNANDQYFAYELSDPNHSPNDCSRMTLNGSILTCPCSNDENQYELNLGLPTSGGGEYGLKRYRASRTGDVVIVSN